MSKYLHAGLRCGVCLSEPARRLSLLEAINMIFAVSADGSRHPRHHQNQRVAAYCKMVLLYDTTADLTAVRKHFHVSQGPIQIQSCAAVPVCYAGKR